MNPMGRRVAGGTGELLLAVRDSCCYEFDCIVDENLVIVRNFASLACSNLGFSGECNPPQILSLHGKGIASR